METNDSLTKEYFFLHLNTCWGEYRHFKETKDKIVFFIGTLFISVLFGSGILIYKSFDQDSNEEIKSILNRLYVVQYLLMHLFFFLLYLYYTYNNVLEKIFLIEVQCCQSKIKQKFPQLTAVIPSHFGLLKKYYSDGVKTNYLIKGRSLKDLSNIIMVIIYFIFSTIPLLFHKDFILFNTESNSTELKFKFSWLIIGGLAIVLLAIVIIVEKILIQNIKKSIIENWKVKEVNDDKI